MCHGAFALADQAVTGGEWLAFIDDGGYRRPELWLSDGWAMVQAEGWEYPLYWLPVDGGWQEFTLGGRLRSTRPNRCATSATTKQTPTPTGPERTSHRGRMGGGGRAGDRSRATSWTRPSCTRPRSPSRRRCHPFGNVWQWTSSAYSPYPGFAPAPGAVGEYNGKFMVNQYVLRGGSCVTPPDHIRSSYRNFFPPSARWAFAGLRLARNC